jgi:hypothetical protein
MCGIHKDAAGVEIAPVCAASVFFLRHGNTEAIVQVIPNAK